MTRGSNKHISNQKCYLLKCNLLLYRSFYTLFFKRLPGYKYAYLSRALVRQKKYTLFCKNINKYFIPLL